MELGKAYAAGEWVKFIYCRPRRIASKQDYAKAYRVEQEAKYESYCTKQQVSSRAQEKQNGR